MRYFFSTVLSIILFLVLIVWGFNFIVLKQIISPSFFERIVDIAPLEKTMDRVWQKQGGTLLALLKFPASAQTELKNIIFSEIITAEEIRKQTKTNISSAFRWINGSDKFENLKIEYDLRKSNKNIENKLIPYLVQKGLPQQLAGQLKQELDLPDTIDVIRETRIAEESTDYILEMREVYKTARKATMYLGFAALIIALLIVFILKNKKVAAAGFLAAVCLFTSLPFLLIALLGKIFFTKEVSNINISIPKELNGLLDPEILNNFILNILLMIKNYFLWWGLAFLTIFVILLITAFALKKRVGYNNS